MSADERGYALADEVRRGAEADQLLANPMLQEAFAKVEERIIKDWRIASASDTDHQRNLLMLLKALDKVRGYITTTAQTGRMASITLAQQRGSE